MSKIEECWVVQRDDGKYLQRIFINKYGTKVCSFTDKENISQLFTNYEKALLKLDELDNCAIISIKRPIFNRGFAKSIHNGRRDRLYPIWEEIKQRCFNSNNKSYKDYGGRGITMCKEWLNYGVFRDWALENGYNPNAKRFENLIDRIDNNGNYEPSNCRWVDRKTQNNNKRNSIKITYNGETHTLIEWAKKLDINKQTLYGRLRRSNYNAEKAFLANRYERISIVGEDDE